MSIHMLKFAKEENRYQVKNCFFREQQELRLKESSVFKQRSFFQSNLRKLRAKIRLHLSIFSADLGKLRQFFWKNSNLSKPVWAILHLPKS